jgi:DNA-binding Xre family transcriptional regulator
VLILRFTQEVEAYRAANPERRFQWTDLADRAGVTTATLSLMEDPGYNATLRTLEKVARALGIPACRLVEEVSDVRGKRIVEGYRKKKGEAKKKAGRQK